MLKRPKVAVENDDEVNWIVNQNINFDLFKKNKF